MPTVMLLEDVKICVYIIYHNKKTYHEALVPRLDLLPGKIRIVNQECHVLFGQLFAAGAAHVDCSDVAVFVRPTADGSTTAFK